MDTHAPKAVMPIVTVESVDEIRHYYIDTLRFDHVRGAIGKDGKFDFCTVAKDGARIMFTRPRGRQLDIEAPGSKQGTEIYLEVANVDEYFSQVLKLKGIIMTEELVTQWWGDRTFKIMDPMGNEIWFYQTVGKPKLPQDLKIV